MSIDKFTRIDDLAREILAIEKDELEISKQNGSALETLIEALSSIYGTEIIRPKASPLFNRDQYVATPFYYHNLEDDTWFRLEKVAWLGNRYTTTTNALVTTKETIFNQTVSDFLSDNSETGTYDLIHFKDIRFMTIQVAGSNEINADFVTYGQTLLTGSGLVDEPQQYTSTQRSMYLKPEDNILLRCWLQTATDVFVYEFKIYFYKQLDVSQVKLRLNRTF